MPERKGLEPGSTFAGRLNYLIANDPRELTDAEICAGIEAIGGHLSATQLGKLRKGTADNPTLSTAHYLAAFFGVEQAFLTDFTDPAVVRRTGDELALKILREKAGVKEVLFRMGTMSPEAIKVLSTVSEQLIELNQEHAPKKGRSGKQEK